MQPSNAPAPVPDSERKKIVVTMDESYNSLNAQALEECAERIAALINEANRGVLIVLDFSKNEYFNSRLLEVLFCGWKRAQDSKLNIDIRTMGLKGFGKEIFQMIHMDRIWPPLQESTPMDAY